MKKFIELGWELRKKIKKFDLISIDINLQTIFI